mmetsp:Transcript_41865/g.87495  ORF Transcript_41865/g.87495 Transcript_41865/m.87495 type:complete len:101 (-) Transcript_41865:885-1187(-)
MIRCPMSLVCSEALSTMGIYGTYRLRGHIKTVRPNRIHVPPEIQRGRDAECRKRRIPLLGTGSDTKRQKESVEVKVARACREKIRDIEGITGNLRRGNRK